MIRRLVLIPVLLAIWVMLFAWAAGVPWGAPWSASEHLALSARDLQIQYGEGDNVPEGLAIRAFGDNNTGLQTAKLAHVRAERYPILRYRIAGFSDKLELALVFRRADTKDDVHTVSLPTPREEEMVVDLTRFDEWRDEINEIGFAEYATAQLVPASTAASFEPFRIVSAQLQAPAWDIILPRLRSDWFGYRPWSLQSINTIGQGRGTLGGTWMMPILALGLILSGLAAWIGLGWSRARAMTAACSIAVCAWFVLDLRWLGDFYAKHQVTEDVYAGKSWTQRVALQPDEDTKKAADDLARIAHERGAERVLVQSDSVFTMLRLIYFLLPLNTAPFEQTMNEASTTALPRNALIALYGSAWKYDKETGQLENGDKTIPAEAVYEKDGLRVFQYKEASP